MRPTGAAGVTKTQASRFFESCLEKRSKYLRKTSTKGHTHRVFCLGSKEIPHENYASYGFSYASPTSWVDCQQLSLFLPAISAL